MRKLTLVSISELRQSEEQGKLYDPPSDFEIEELVRSIDKDGLLEEPIITEDNMIISGHRRVLACMRLGRKSIRCEVKPIKYYGGHGKFLRLLREANRHRVKKISEVLKEQIVDVANSKAESELDREIIERSNIDVEKMELGDTKVRKKIKGNKPILDAVKNIVFNFKAFWPLSDRFIHYKLLNDPPLIHEKKEKRYANDDESYEKLTDILTRGRLIGDIPWESISDETRPFVSWSVYPNIAPFINEQLNGFMKGYFRNLQQSQPNWIEIVGEKVGLRGIINPVAMHFCIPYTLGKGFSSLSPRHDIAERFKKSEKVSLILLFLADHDPSGLKIARSFAESMRDDFDIDNIYPIRVALNWDQIQSLKIPRGYEIKRKKETRDETGRVKEERGSKTIRKEYIQKYGQYGYELEALPPDILQQMLRDAIISVINVDLFNEEIKKEKEEQVELDQYRERVFKTIQDERR